MIACDNFYIFLDNRFFCGVMNIKHLNFQSQYDIKKQI